MNNFQLHILLANFFLGVSFLTDKIASCFILMIIGFLWLILAMVDYKIMEKKCK